MKPIETPSYLRSLFTLMLKTEMDVWYYISNARVIHRHLLNVTLTNVRNRSRINFYLFSSWSICLLLLSTSLLISITLFVIVSILVIAVCLLYSCLREPLHEARSKTHHPQPQVYQTNYESNTSVQNIVTNDRPYTQQSTNIMPFSMFLKNKTE